MSNEQYYALVLEVAQVYIDEQDYTEEEAIRQAERDLREDLQIMNHYGEL